MHATEAARRSRSADDGLQFLPLLRGALRGVSGDGDAPRLSPTATSTISPISVMAAAPATSTASSRRRTNSTSTFRRFSRGCAPTPMPAYAWPRALSRCSRATVWQSLSAAAIEPRGFRRSASSRSRRCAVVRGTRGRRRVLPDSCRTGRWRWCSAPLRLCARWRWPWASACSGAISASRAQPRDAAPPFWQAIKDAGQLRYLDGGGERMHERRASSPATDRALFHHLTLYGFLLCFAATCVGDALSLCCSAAKRPIRGRTSRSCSATVGWHRARRSDRPASLRRKLRRDPGLRDAALSAWTLAFLAMLFLTGA